MLEETRVSAFSVQFSIRVSLSLNSSKCCSAWNEKQGEINQESGISRLCNAVKTFPSKHLEGHHGDTSHRIYLLEPCGPSLCESAGLRVELGEFAQRGAQLPGQERVLLSELLHGHVQLRQSVRAVLQLLTQGLYGNKHQQMILFLTKCSLKEV